MVFPKVTPSQFIRQLIKNNGIILYYNLYQLLPQMLVVVHRFNALARFGFLAVGYSRIGYLQLIGKRIKDSRFHQIAQRHC